LKPTIGTERLHKINNDNGGRVVNFVTSKNFVAKSTMFSHHNIHKYTWSSDDGNTHSQIDHVLIDRRRHSSILDVRSFRGADCDIDRYLVVAKVRERLAVSKRAAQKIDMEKFNVKKLNEEDIKGQYQVTIRNTFSALENLEDSGDINRAWNNIRTSKFRPKRVQDIVNRSIVNRGLIWNIQNCLIEGSRLNYSGCRTQVK
jgi:hypothetical protein